MTTNNPLKDMYRRDIAERIQALRDKIAAETKEILDLEDILHSLGGPLTEMPGANANVVTFPDASIPARRRTAARREPQPMVEHTARSIPELILDILRRSPRGLKAPQIIAELQSLRPKTAPSSIYPSLLKMSLSSIGTIRRTGSGRAALYFPAKEGTP